jgi:hypothetical protein
MTVVSELPEVLYICIYVCRAEVPQGPWVGDATLDKAYVGRAI